MKSPVKWRFLIYLVLMNEGLQRNNSLNFDGTTTYTIHTVGKKAKKLIELNSITNPQTNIP